MNSKSTHFHVAAPLWIAVLVSGITHAATAVWTSNGTGGANWSDGTNWSGGQRLSKSR